MMFAPFCPTHDSTVLMTRRNIIDFRNGPDGPVIHWRCNCGHEGVMDRHGTTDLVDDRRSRLVHGRT